MSALGLSHVRVNSRSEEGWERRKGFESALPSGNSSFRVIRSGEGAVIDPGEDIVLALNG